MADATDPDAPHDSSSTDRDPDWYEQQWTAVCDELGTSEPNEVLARIQTLKREMNRPAEDDADGEGLVTISEVEEVFRDMNEKMERLRERNASLAERLEGDDEAEGAFHDLHRKTEELLETLDAPSMADAHDRIQRLNERLEDLYREKELLVQAGLSDAQDALDEIERLRDDREAIQRERDQLRAELDQREETRDRPASEDDTTSSVDPDTSVLEAAVVIRQRLGISTAEQAEALTQIVQQVYERLRERAQSQDAAIDDAPENVVEMLHSMSAQLDALPDPDALPGSAAEALGVATTSEARTLATTVRRVSDRIFNQYETSAAFEAEVREADEVMTLLHRIEDQLEAAPPPEGSSPSNDALPAEAGDILGIRTIEDARELDALIGDLHEDMERLQEEHRCLSDAGLSAEEALLMIEDMEEQLADLYRNGEYPSEQTRDASPDDPTLDDALARRIESLTNTSPETAENVTEVVRALVDRLEELSSEQNVLHDVGLDAHDAVTLIESMEAQLNALYREKKVHGDAPEQLAAIEEMLGISTPGEAQVLSQIARQMEEQLATLYREKKALDEVGLSSVEDAVDTIEHLEEQLTGLYDEQDASGDGQREAPDHGALRQQLDIFYAEQRKIQDALGVSTADDIIEMVESLHAQLSDLYAGRDATVDPNERLDVRRWVPKAVGESTEIQDVSPDAPAHSRTDTLTMNSMEHQLEALYREKETLLHHGFNSAEAVVEQLKTQQRQIDALQRENRTHEQRFSRLKSELGTERVARIVKIVHTLEGRSDASLDDVRAEANESSESIDYGVDIEAASPFVPEDTLNALDEMDPAELDTLNVGVVQLGDDGTVDYLNEQALQLPGLRDIENPQDVIGKNFFLDLAPSTNNNLFYGRFQRGQQRGRIDARFPYTFISPNDEPASFAVHLHRTPDANATWLLYRPA